AMLRTLARQLKVGAVALDRSGQKPGLVKRTLPDEVIQEYAPELGELFGGIDPASAVVVAVGVLLRAVHRACLVGKLAVYRAVQGSERRIGKQLLVDEHRRDLGVLRICAHNGVKKRRDFRGMLCSAFSALAIVAQERLERLGLSAGAGGLVGSREIPRDELSDRSERLAEKTIVGHHLQISLRLGRTRRG